MSNLHKTVFRVLKSFKGQDLDIDQAASLIISAATDSEKQATTQNNHGVDEEQERAFLQGIFENQNTPLERAIFENICGRGSPPSVWSHETLRSAHYMRRVFQLGWEAGLRAQAQGDDVTSAR